MFLLSFLICLWFIAILPITAPSIHSFIQKMKILDVLILGQVVQTITNHHNHRVDRNHRAFTAVSPWLGAAPYTPAPRPHTFARSELLTTDWKVSTSVHPCYPLWQQGQQTTFFKSSDFIWIFFFEQSKNILRLLSECCNCPLESFLKKWIRW